MHGPAAAFELGRRRSGDGGGQSWKVGGVRVVVPVGLVGVTSRSRSRSLQRRSLPAIAGQVD
jgi:hypothetical protein